jgi:hypothetical protein
MSDFVRLPIEVTPQAMLEEAIAEMEAQLPDWNVKLGEYEVILFQAIIWRMIWPFVQLAANVDAAIFNEWGRQIVNVVPQEAQKAVVTSTWTVIDNAGYTITAGTQVDIARTGDERLGFVVAADVTIGAGKTSTGAGEVVLEAIEPGLDGNGLSGAGILIDALGFVEDITIIGESEDGADAEDPERYLGRLAETMQTFIEGVVVANDVAIVARNVAGIGRVAVIDNYNAETEKDEQEKTTTVVVTGDDAASAATAEAKADVKETLEGKREVNYLFFVIDPDYNLIDVEAVIVPMQGFSQTATAANVVAAIESLLDPNTHGQQPPGNDASWVLDTKLRYQDLVTAVNNAEGVDYYTTLKWRKAAEAMAAADLTLAGGAPLPKPDTITVT